MMRPTPADGDLARARLIEAARTARRRARAPYSLFKVGAAIEAADGSIVGGCNIENASYGLTTCAERVAVFAAVAAGHRRFRRLAIVTAGPAPTPPCGACRQVLWELAPDIEIVLAGSRGKSHSIPLKALLPLPFDRRRLTRW